MKHTLGPWEIHWYHCRMDQSDVEHAKANGNLSAKVGDVLWRAPRSIGPCGSEHSHWGGDLLTVEEADAHLIAAAPCLLKALQLMVDRFLDTEGSYGSFENEALDAAYAAIRKATGDD